MLKPVDVLKQEIIEDERLEGSAAYVHGAIRYAVIKTRCEALGEVSRAFSMVPGIREWCWDRLRDMEPAISSVDGETKK